MEKCQIHTIIGRKIGGFISGCQVYPDDKNALFYDFLHPYLLPVESGCKWGLMNVNTGELSVPMEFDYTSPLVYGVSHAVKNGLHGYINMHGETVLPFQYEDACNKSSPDGYFAVKSGKWGVVNKKQEQLVPFDYDKIFLNCCFDRNVGWFQPYAGISAIRDGHIVLFDKHDYVIADNLTSYPRGYGDYLLIQNNRKFGVVCQDGRAITNVTLLKREALHLIHKLKRD